MILYCIVCYLVMIGILLDENKSFDDLTSADIMCFILAPILVPIFLGMFMNNTDKY